MCFVVIGNMWKFRFVKRFNNCNARMLLSKDILCNLTTKIQQDLGNLLTA
jgi:hypothetical protein